MIRTLVIISCISGGLLAGGDLYRYVIEVPAWRNLQITDWLGYSRRADLGNGIILFPAEALISSLALIVAYIMWLRNRNFNPVSWLLFLSTIFAIAGLVFTVFAAPVMLNLPKTGTDAVQLHKAFNTFHFWGMLRAVAQILSFIFSVIALSNIYKLNNVDTETTNSFKIMSYEDQGC